MKQNTLKNIIIGVLATLLIGAICLYPIVIQSHNLSQNSVIPTLSNTPTGQQPVTFGENATRSDMAEEYLGAIATVNIVKATTGSTIGFGSGIAVADGGYLLTNFHVIYSDVVEPANYSITLTMQIDGVLTEGISAEVLWYNANLDLAVLKSEQNFDCYVEMADRWITPKDNQKLRIAEDVWTLGTPYNLNYWGSYSQGTISSADMRICTTEVGNVYFTHSNMIQHTAPISSGNSGGPLFDATGKLIGLNTCGCVSSESKQANGLFFAVPIYPITLVLENIIEADQDEQADAWQTPKLNITAYDKNSAELASKNVEFTQDGIYVYALTNTTNAYEAGLRSGDVIIAIGDEDCTGADDDTYTQINLVHELAYELMKYKSGDTITVYFKSGLQSCNAKIQLD